MYTYDDISVRRLAYSDRNSVAASITRPDNITAYDAGDVVGPAPAANMTFSAVLLMAGSLFSIKSVTLEMDAAAVPSGMTSYRLHLFRTAPTAIADGTAFALADADRSKYLGFILIETPVDLGGTIWYQNHAVNFIGKMAEASTTLYGILETVGAFTPASQTVTRVTLNISGV